MSPYGKNYSVLAPGPVNLHPAVRRSIVVDDSPPHPNLTNSSKALSGLKKFFKRNNLFYFKQHRLWGMEALMVNTWLRVRKLWLLILENLENAGLKWQKASAISFIDWENSLGKICGTRTNPTAVLDRHPKTQAVFCQACETSTEPLHPLQKISKIFEGLSSCVVFVDGITAVGAMNVPMDDWGLMASLLDLKRLLCFPPD